MGREAGGGEGIGSRPAGGEGNMEQASCSGLRFFSRISPCFLGGKLLPPAHLRVNLSVHVTGLYSTCASPVVRPPEPATVSSTLSEAVCTPETRWSAHSSLESTALESHK